jgi:hypothetical protein
LLTKSLHPRPVGVFLFLYVQKHSHSSDAVEACLVKESENEVGQDDAKMDDAGDEETVGEIEDLDLLEGSQIKVEEPAL